MRNVIEFVVFFGVLFPVMISASLGPNVSRTADGKDLRWEEGSRDYFVMFKSLVEDRNGTTGSATNPQADTCIDYNTGSTFSLQENHIPEDAYVEAAYLIWTAGADPSLFNGGLTDNSVLLSFESKDGSVVLSEQIVSSVEGTFQTSPSFEYEALKSSIATTGYFMYRVEVTDFMQEIIEKGREAGSAFDGYSLLGNYNVSETTCTNHDNYVSRSLVVGDWVLFFVYTSEKIQPKKIYVYNGLSEYQHIFEDINVTGFELPDEAELRLTLVVHEGDPGNVYGTNNPEALSLSGAQTFDWVQLTNTCNPPLIYSGMNYVEVYNSVSSLYGWNDTVPYCVGGVPPNYNLGELQYALDVDTFFMSAKDPVYAPHLIKGDDNFWLKVSANQDVVYTNILIISIDTKAPKFDIPPNPDTPDGREKNYCSCSTEGDAVCDDRPFYFTIKIENWGENIANDVTLKDALPALAEYIPGTTEILIKKDGVAGKWEKVEDIGGKFPYLEPKTVMETMYYCDKATLQCNDSVTVRFKVKPASYIQKHQVIENTAMISDSSGISYLSNSSIPLRLRLGKCPPVTDCPEPPKEQCGGTGGPECVKDEDCEEGYKCEKEKCVLNADDLTKDAVIKFAEGKNTPQSEGSAIIITNPSENLVTAQFTLIAEGESGSFKFNSIAWEVNKSETNTSVTNFRLVYDLDGNGEFGADEKILATLQKPADFIAELIILKETDRYFKAGTLHHFLVVADAEHSEEVVSSVRFNLKINDIASINVSDSGNAVLECESLPLDFATFRFEPANAFIVSKGANDPPIVPVSGKKENVPVLQIRTKSMQGNDVLKSLSFKTTQKSVKFGEGIKKGTLYLDVDGDGKISEKDEQLGILNNAENGYMTFDLNISYTKQEEKFFLISLDLELKENEMAQIQIPETKVKLTESKEIVELPVTSKEFPFSGCKDGDENCDESDEEKSEGCSCAVVSCFDQTESELIVLTSILFALLLSVLIRKTLF